MHKAVCALCTFQSLGLANISVSFTPLHLIFKLRSTFFHSYHNIHVPIMERDTYAKLTITRADLDSDQETITLRSPRQDTVRRLSSMLWLVARIVFIAIGVITWSTSVWLNHLTSTELGRALPHISLSGSSRIPGFIPGGSLSVPGHGLIYNTSYCNGWEDPEGARSRGCILDLSQGGWVHELCHDPDLLAEWMTLPDFGWYLDANRTQRIPQERIWASDIPGGVNTMIYTSLAYHIEHCRFVFRLRIENSMRKNRGVGYLELAPSHLNHCLRQITIMDTPAFRESEVVEVIWGMFASGRGAFGYGGECYMPIL